MDLPFDELKYRNVDGISGLVLIIAQDSKTNEVLMVAFANRRAIEKTVVTGKAHYFSTSRKKLWMKGESSGHVQEVKEVLLDCDGDAVLYKVEQKGGACHKGYKSCFYRKLGDAGFETIGEKLFDSDAVYGKK